MDACLWYVEFNGTQDFQQLGESWSLSDVFDDRFLMSPSDVPHVSENSEIHWWVHVCGMLRSMGVRTSNNLDNLGGFRMYSTIFCLWCNKCAHEWYDEQSFLASTWCRSTIILGTYLKSTYTSRRPARSGRCAHGSLMLFTRNQRATIDKLLWFYNCVSICSVHISATGPLWPERSV